MCDLKYAPHWSLCECRCTRATLCASLSRKLPTALQAFGASLSFPPSPSTRVMPESGHFHNWSRVLSSFSSDPGTLVRALHAHQTHLYAGASTATQKPDLVRFSACHPTHEFPSNRARALFNAHFVLLIEYSLDAKLGSKRVCVMQAHVHGSQKGSVMYFPHLKFVASPCTNHFDLDDADCSCIAGCDLAVLIAPDSCLQLIWSLCPAVRLSTNQLQ